MGNQNNDANADCSGCACHEGSADTGFGEVKKSNAAIRVAVEAVMKHLAVRLIL